MAVWGHARGFRAVWGAFGTRLGGRRASAGCEEGRARGVRGSFGEGLFAGRGVRLGRGEGSLCEWEARVGERAGKGPRGCPGLPREGARDSGGVGGVGAHNLLECGVSQGRSARAQSEENNGGGRFYTRGEQSVVQRDEGQGDDIRKGREHEGGKDAGAGTHDGAGAGPVGYRCCKDGAHPRARAGRCAWERQSRGWGRGEKQSRG